MSDLFEDAQPGQNTPEFTVSEISGEIKRTLEGTFGRIRVRGEVGRVFKARSGHLYYDVKDDRNVLACTTWKGQVAGLSVVPDEGLEVIVTGRLTSFGAQSKYNMNVDEVDVAGQGALMALLEKRKKQLQSEGLFDAARKQKLPFLPEVIGVVTSPSGAVIRDILHRLRDRFPRKVLIWPVAVQGAACAPEVARAIKGFNALTAGGAMPRPDLLIVARGGGSVEDLWGFNEEVVARAASESVIPLISAVGHESDTTLIDFVSDQRAPTPTAAAELAVPVRLELIAWSEDQAARLIRAASLAVTGRSQRLSDLARALPRPGALTAGPQQRLDLIAERLPNALRRGTQTRAVKLATSTARLRPLVLSQLIEAKRDRLRARVAGLHPRQLQRDLGQRKSNIEALTRRLDIAGKQALSGWKTRIDATSRLLSTLGYQATLERGYAVVRAQGKGRLVTTKSEAAKVGALEIQFADGRLEVAEKSSNASVKPKSKASTKAPDKGTDQGSLF